MTVYFSNWMRDAEVYGEAAGFTFGDRVLDLVVTYCDDGTFAWEVVDECTSIGCGTSPTAELARRAAETAARKQAMCIA